MNILLFGLLWLIVGTGVVMLFGNLIPQPTKADDDEQYEYFNRRNK